jgi:myo-inositol-1(or 4)-monophosphatase
MRDIIKIASTAAHKAGDIIRNNMNITHSVTMKGPVDLVTETDKAAEETIIEILSAETPEFSILAEESGAVDRKSAGRWIVDPLDGTTNFAHGIPIVSVSVAFERNSEYLAGLVYQPLWDEEYTATKGDGAFLNGRSIEVSNTAEVDKSLLLTGFPYDLRVNCCYPIDIFKAFLLRSQAIRRCGSAALDMCFLASGKADGFWELSLHPWDTAAGLVIASEAGANITRFDGSPFNPFEKDILASNGFIHQEMIDIIAKVQK